MTQELWDITEKYNLPEAVQKVFTAKAIHSAAVIASLFQDDEEFTDFFEEEFGPSRRLKIALKMVYFDALQCARRSGQAVHRSSSPVSNSTPSASEDVGQQLESQDEEAADNS